MLHAGRPDPRCPEDRGGRKDSRLVESKTGARGPERVSDRRGGGGPSATWSNTETLNSILIVLNTNKLESERTIERNSGGGPITAKSRGDSCEPEWLGLCRSGALPSSTWSGMESDDSGRLLLKIGEGKSVREGLRNDETKPASV